MGAVIVNEEAVVKALRAAGARFALVHGSRAGEGQARPDSDLDVGAWWPHDPPAAWDVPLPPYVDLVVLNDAPLWRYPDEIPQIRERYRRRRARLAGGLIDG